MAEQTLREFELAADETARKKYEKDIKRSAAQDKAMAANNAYNKALNDLCNEYDNYGQAYKDKMKAYKETFAAKDRAEKELAEAKEAYDNAAAEAKVALDALEAKKEELRKSAKKDTSFVVHTARVECSCGTQNTFLALEEDHGVVTKGFPQMLVTDMKFDENIFDFWGCKSAKNPNVMKEADAAVEKVRTIVKESGDWRDRAMNALYGKQEINATDSVCEEIIAECIGELPGNIVWEKGQENMEINGKKPILRRCKLKCIYGGSIIVLLSGQPE